jgi:endogenous inhibitor of DNA gyrase (YacG/DUF329 family)
MRCPVCKQPVEAGSKYRPFCSERCKLIDLGRWLNGSYAIPGEPASEEDLTEDLLASELEALANDGGTKSRRRN